MTTVIEDNVHGQMIVPSYFMDIIYTEEFQRLRNLKQLGLSNIFFSGAVHSRFEHCIGTGYLSYTLLETLEKNSGVKINEILKKCVTIAGLLHDLGHGPFSHLWEHLVHSGVDKTWTHEKSSCYMVVQLFEANGISLWNTKKEHNFCLELIQALIVGDIIKLKQLLSTEMNFLSEIVNNKFCNIDVDKVDYLLRDAYHLKNSIEFMEDFSNFLNGARIVTDSNGLTHIGFRVQDYPQICQMFEYRAALHISVYQDRQVSGVEQLLVDALLLAECGGFTFKNVKLTEVQNNLKLYTHLDDTILKFIELSEDPEMMEAQELLKRLKQGRFYEVIDETSTRFDINVLNKQFGNNFLIKQKKVPAAEIPTNIILFNEQGVVPAVSTSKTLSFESFIIYSKSECQATNDKAKSFMKFSNNNF